MECSRENYTLRLSREELDIICLAVGRTNYKVFGGKGIKSKAVYDLYMQLLDIQ